MNKAVHLTTGILSRLVEKIVDNLQIELKNVHIRYEDSTTDPKVMKSIFSLMISPLLRLVLPWRRFRLLVQTLIGPRASYTLLDLSCTRLDHM